MVQVIAVNNKVSSLDRADIQLSTLYRIRFQQKTRIVY